MDLDLQAGTWKAGGRQPWIHQLTFGQLFCLFRVLAYHAVSLKSILGHPRQYYTSLSPFYFLYLLLWFCVCVVLGGIAKNTHSAVRKELMGSVLSFHLVSS